MYVCVRVTRQDLRHWRSGRRGQLADRYGVSDPGRRLLARRVRASAHRQRVVQGTAGLI